MRIKIGLLHDKAPYFKVNLMIYFGPRLRHPRDCYLCQPLHLRQRETTLSPTFPPHRRSASKVQTSRPAKWYLCCLWHSGQTSEETNAILSSGKKEIQEVCLCNAMFYVLGVSSKFHVCCYQLGQLSHQTRSCSWKVKDFIRV